MAAKIGSSSVSCMSTSFYSPSRSSRSSKVTFPALLFGSQNFDAENQRNAKAVNLCQLIHGRLKVKRRFSKRQYVVFASSKDILPSNELNEEDQQQEKEKEDSLFEDISYVDNIGGTGGKPGIISFYNHPYKQEADVLVSTPVKNKNNVLWFVGPAVLVASFIFPSLYLRRILSTVFEDSLLTDFLILFFTEALFYGGVAMFLFIVDQLRRPVDPVVVTSFKENPPQLEYRITSVAVLVLSLVIPMVTMGFVWPWTGPAASATLAPYLVGIVVQFAFEQYAKYSKSPSLPLIPVIFQVYRLHQLNRAAQLVTALSFTVRGAEMTSHNLAINSSLGTLLNVLQCLGVICIWSLSSFLMKFLPSSATLTQQ